MLKQNGCLVPEPSPVDLIDLAAVSREPGTELKDDFINMFSTDVEAYVKEHFDKSARKPLGYTSIA
ncbi:MAG: DUF1302 domain-containing protein [Lachnospiraceae bacterium]|nr:DUF1302 domain-containing protein [Lachnospiraceae bacterium]